MPDLSPQSWHDLVERLVINYLILSPTNLALTRIFLAYSLLFITLGIYNRAYVYVCYIGSGR